MNPMEEPPPEDRDRVFTGKPKWQRAIVLAAGSFTHFVLAFLLLASLFWFVGVPRFGDRPEVAAVEPRLEGESSPAAQAGLRPGDVFVEVDGREVSSMEEFSDHVAAHPGERLTVVVERDGRRLAVGVTPILSSVQGEEQGRLGVLLQTQSLGRDRSGPIEGIVDAGRVTGQMAVGSFQALGKVFGPEGIQAIGEALVGERSRSANDPVGVVGAARVSGQAAAAGQFDVILTLFAFFNVFVGILNILPLPPLDGGHLAVLGFEGITGRRVDQRKLIPITALVAGFLILFTFSLLYLDVARPIPNPFQ
jgi:RIP metalloprotease RseP